MNEILVSKASKGIKVFSLFLLLIGFFNIQVGLAHSHNTTFLIIGCVSFFLGIGIFKLWNWVRLAAIVFCVAFILLIYIPLIVGAFFIQSRNQLFYGAALGFHFPLLVASLLCIFFLTRPKFKNQFRKNS